MSAPLSEAEKGDIVILFTSDIHCGLEQGFGVEGLLQIRKTMEKQGISTLLVDNGDAIQGEVIGTLSKGESIVAIMNYLNYDAAIPGNHEFDCGADWFLELSKKANYPYISCNLKKNGELVFPPYLIKEVNGTKIGFVGVTTPRTLTSCNPENFKDSEGNIVYDFCLDQTGEALIAAIQGAVDDARKEGAEYVILMAHIGNSEALAPYNFQTIIENTTGINALLDGHSHDTDQVIMNNKDGEQVPRSGCGTKLQAVGYARISGKDKTLTAGIYTWNNPVSVPSLLGITNEVSEPLKTVNEKMDQELNVVVGHSDVDLVDSDPNKTDDSGNPLRIIRGRETNLGDLIADAMRVRTKSDICLFNAGGIRASIKAGDITYGKLIAVMPFSNQICVSRLSGQQIIDALEWGTAKLPGSPGAFLQVSGLSYEVHLYIPSSFTVGTDGYSAEVTGEYRVKNVRINGEPIDPKAYYTVSGADFVLRDHGSGFGMMGPEDVVINEIGLDNQFLIDYINEDLNGTVGEEYHNPYGQGRITVYETKPE